MTTGIIEVSTPTEQPPVHHPLHNTWVIWYDNPRLAPEGSDWKDNLKLCGEFSTVEQFWSIFNNIKPASTLAVNSNYHVFRQGVQPMWEDPQNKLGGKFVLTMPKKDSKAGRCDEWWLYTLLSILGETLDINGNQVCGAGYQDNFQDGSGARSPG